MTAKIFINYRRDDSAAHALNIAQYLEREFGAENVFIDVDRIGAGQDFPAVLKEKLAQCKVMITVIGPSWLTLADKKGRRRIDDPDDWVRLEISQALSRNIAIIPVLVGGAGMPDKSEISDELHPVLARHAATITTNGFRNEMAGLKRDVLAISGFRRQINFFQASVAVVLVAALAATLFSVWLPTFSGGKTQISSGPNYLSEKTLAKLVHKALDLTADGQCSRELMNASLFATCNQQLNWLAPALKKLGPIRNVQSLGLGTSRGAPGIRFNVEFQGGETQIWLATGDQLERLTGLWTE